MSQTVELGRAVITLPSINLELWLTTSITISSDTDDYRVQHPSINLNYIEPSALLDYLSTGDVWVNRGTAMYMSLKFRKLERPLDQHCLQQLGKCIVNAPAWKQFGHRLSSPLNYDPVDGDLRINIGQRHQVETSTDATDADIAFSRGMGVKPPEGTPIVRFDSVDFVISIFETQDRRALRKRAKHVLPRQTDHSGKAEDHVHETKYLLNHERRSRSGFETVEFSRPNADHEASDESRAKSGAQRSSTSPVNSIPSARGKKKRALTLSELPMVSVTNPKTSEVDQLAGLTDVALRYSICLGVKGSSLGPKIKASTFVYGLTDIAPALWRAGYVSALSQAIYTNPVIGRSLGRISLSARSPDLKVKLRALSESATTSINEHMQCLGERSIAEKTISDRVWIHTLKSQMSKTPASLVQAFCIPTTVDVIAEQDSEILEERNNLVNTSHNHQDGIGSTSSCLADTQSHLDTVPTLAHEQVSTSLCLDPIPGDLISHVQHATQDPGVCKSSARETHASPSRDTTGPVDAIEGFDPSLLVADHDDSTQTLYGNTRVGNEGLLFDYEEPDENRS